MFARTRTGQDTLHGGIYGWDRRNWTVLARTGTSVTYHHLDAADEGFPGDVDATVRPPHLPLSPSPRYGVSTSTLTSA